jgi:hypothetical protein
MKMGRKRFGGGKCYIWLSFGRQKLEVLLQGILTIFAWQIDKVQHSLE